MLFSNMKLFAMVQQEITVWILNQVRFGERKIKSKIKVVNITENCLTAEILSPQELKQY